MNNDHYARYSTSLHCNGSELPFPQLPEISVENEELAFNSYYPSTQNATSFNNPGFYRPYDTVSCNNNDEWQLGNSSNVFSVNGPVGNRNVFGNNPVSDLVDMHSTWPHFSEPNYSHYSHYTNNANFWPQLYFPQNTYDCHAHDYRYPAPLKPAVEDSNESYDLDVEQISVDSPSISVSTPQSSTYPNELYSYPIQHNHQQSFPHISNDVQPQHPLPIRPIPQQAAKGDPTHQCPACYRFCVSAGGLKRHAKFCRASPTNLENIFASLKRPDQTESVPGTNFQGNADPVNLSSEVSLVEINQPVTDLAPANFSVTDLVPAASILTTLNNNNESPSITMVDEPVEKILNLPSIPVDFGDLAKKSTKLSETSSSRRRNCPQCNLVLPSERALVDHLVTHNVDKPYECVTCGSRFSRKFHLTRHVKQRGCDGTPRAEFPCEYCSKMFSRKDNLREHVKSHTGQSRPRTKLPCPIPSCDKEFQGRTQLQVHLNFHSGLRPYACDRDECDKTFRSNAALKKHLRIHNSEKPFQCPQCDARFLAKESLARHMSSHDILKPIKSFVCNRCGMAFIQQLQLKKHIMKDHQPAESFRCTVCSRTYKRRWRLLHHYKTEHAEKPSTSSQTDFTNQRRSENSTEESFECGVCSKRFSTRESLKSHYLAHVIEREPPMSCSECSRVYTRRDCLLRHLRTKHRLPPDQALEVMEKMSFNKGPYLNLTFPVTDPLNTDLNTDVSSCSTQSAYEPKIHQDLPQTINGDLFDVNILEGNIIELLSLLVDPNALRNFGWPNSSVDVVLQTVLVKCSKEPFSNPNLTLAQRLRCNTKMLFSFIVDDQNALENLFARRPVEQVLQQVIQLAKSGESSDNIVQLPL